MLPIKEQIDMVKRPNIEEIRAFFKRNLYFKWDSNDIVIMGEKNVKYVLSDSISSYNLDFLCYMQFSKKSHPN